MITPRPCAICGEPFPSKSIRNKYCSERCKLTANNHVTYRKMIEQGRCPSCHHTKEGDGLVVCTDCRAGNRERYVRIPPRPPFPCIICGTMFIQGSPTAKYCSDECRKKVPGGMCPHCRKRPSSQIKDIKLCDECHEQRSSWWHERSEQIRDTARGNARAWRERNPDYYRGPRGMNGRSNFKVKMEVFDHYGPNCVCCGESHLEFLTIDHIHGKGNNHRRELFGTQGGGGYRFYRWLKRQNFPEGYRVLCYNCNIGVSRCGGICPHQLDKGDS